MQDSKKLLELHKLITKQQFDKIPDEDWETLLAPLIKKRDWEQVWRLAQAAPAIWSMRLLLHVCQEADVEMALQACNYLVAQNHPEAIDILCVRWMDTREAPLAQIIVQKGYVAREPLNVRVFSALQADRMEVIKANEVQYVKALLQACEDRDSTIATPAKLALTHLQDVEAQEILCQLVIEENHALAREIVLEAHHVPREPHQRALLYFLTEQWDKYEQLDVDQQLLKAMYSVVELGVQKRLAVCARRVGRLEWANLVIGRHQEERLSEITAEEWDVTLTVFNKNRMWEEIWWLVQMAPAVWSVRLLLRLKEAAWGPEQETEREAFMQLVRLAEECGEKEADSLISGLGDGVLLKTLKGEFPFEPSSSDDRCDLDWLAISPDGRMLACGVEFRELDRDSFSRTIDKKVCLWSLPDGARLKTLEEHPHCLAISPDGFRKCCEESCVAFSPDGQMRARVSGDGTVWLESLPDYKLLHTLKGHIKRVTCIAMSPDGRLLVSGTEDGTGRLWALWKIRLRRLISEPTRLEHLQLVEDILKEEKVTETERKWLEFVLALMRWQRRFDVEISETPRSISGGEFDVEIDA